MPSSIQMKLKCESSNVLKAIKLMYVSPKKPKRGWIHLKRRTLHSETIKHFLHGLAFMREGKRIDLVRYVRFTLIQKYKYFTGCLNNPIQKQWNYTILLFLNSDSNSNVIWITHYLIVFVIIGDRTFKCVCIWKHFLFCIQD